MAKIKLTKNELKRQKESLARFIRYLPTLQLKKQQLQAEIVKLNHAIEEVERGRKELDKFVDSWIGLFSEDVSLGEILVLKKIETEEGNIAGIDIPVYKGVVFEEKEYDFFSTPLWIDQGLDAVKAGIELRAKKNVLEKQKEILSEEIRITTQRVNLFEKVKIPQARESIRVIDIFLGDVFTAEVVRGKIAKAKLG